MPSNCAAETKSKRQNWFGRAGYLQVQGMVARKRLDGFRDSNTRLAQERGELAGWWKSIRV